MERVVPVVVLAQQELLAPLGHHAQGRLSHAIHPLQRHGVAIQMQPWERLDGPIDTDDSPDPLYQFRAMGVYLLGLAFGLGLSSSPGSSRP